MTYYYLASPYTHPSRDVRHWRYEAVRDFSAWLTLKKEWVFCPIMHSHDMCQHHQFPYEFEFWNEWNQTMIYPSWGLIVFQIDGWQSSRGVRAEIDYAKEIGKPIVYSLEAYHDYDHPEYPLL